MDENELVYFQTQNPGSDSTAVEEKLKASFEWPTLRPSHNRG